MQQKIISKEVKNIEIKVKVPNHKLVFKLLKNNKAKKIGILNQVDTYFNCPNGRLKLREINSKNYELIF